jgi:ParB-like chromosome segregation protein Spo0J
MTIEHLKTSDLIPYARNAKKHDASQVAKLAGSIREFGFTNPVLIDKDNGIIAGHGRVLAAQSLALETVPCIRLGHLTDTQRRAYILADNRLAEIGGGWDEEMLKLELADLKDNLNLEDMGWNSAEIDKLLASGELAASPEIEWEGMPDYEGLEPCLRKVWVNFDREEDVAAFFGLLKQSYTEKTKSIWFPHKERRDLKSQVWESDE